jgi:hypothetical protein
MPDRQLDAAVDATMDVAMDAALRRAPAVQVPPHFANRVMASLPQSPADPAVRWWVAPAVALAATAVVAALGWTAAELGVVRWIVQPKALAAVLGTESAAALVWTWRVYRSVR